MLSLTAVLLGVAAMGFGSTAAHAQDGKYAVVTGAANPNKTTDKETIKQLYLKTLATWPDGVKSTPFARTEGSDIQKAFVAEVLGMTEAELAKHWEDVERTSGTIPPRVIRVDQLTVIMVKKEEGGLSFVETTVAEASKTDVAILLKF